jgi:hypothetical protein
LATITAYASSFNNAIPTGFGFQLANQAGAVGSTEGDPATANAGATAIGNISGNHYYFGTGFDAIPTGSTINSVTLEVRNLVSVTARGTYAYRLDSSPNVQLATEWVPTKVTTITTQSNSALSTNPTLAQLKNGTIGVRARFTRDATQAVTYNLDWVRMTVDYTAPVTTVSGAANIAGSGTTAAVAQSYTPRFGAATLFPVASLSVSGRSAKRAATAIAGVADVSAAGQVTSAGQTTRTARFSFPTPSGSLAIGPDRQEFRVRVRKAGAGADPTIKMEVFETGGGTVLAEPITPTTVSSTSGVTLSGTWDASVLADLTGEDVEVLLTSEGPDGETGVEIGALEWNWAIAPLGYEPVYGAAQIAGDATVSAASLVASRAAIAVSGSASVAASAVKALRGAVQVAGSASASVASVVRKRGASVVSGSASLVASPFVLKRGAAQIGASATVSVQSSGAKAGSAAVAAKGTLSASAVVVKRAACAVAGKGSVTPAPGPLGIAARAALSGTASASAAGLVAKRGAAFAQAQALVSPSPVVARLAAANVAGLATLGAAGRTRGLLTGVRPDATVGLVPVAAGEVDLVPVAAASVGLTPIPGALVLMESPPPDAWVELEPIATGRTELVNA